MLVTDCGCSSTSFDPEEWLAGISGASTHVFVAGLDTKVLHCVLGRFGLSSTEVWCSTSLDQEKSLAGLSGTPTHVFAVDLVISYNTVDREILDCVSGRLGLPGWFRRVFFQSHTCVRLRFKLAAGLEEP